MSDPERERERNERIHEILGVIRLLLDAASTVLPGLRQTKIDAAIRALERLR